MPKFRALVILLAGAALITPAPARAVQLGIIGTPEQYETLSKDGLPLRIWSSWSSWQSVPPEGVLREAARLRAEPLIDWGPYGITLSAIAAGQYDAYIESWAKTILAYQRPVLIRFAHEMNGSWYSWSQEGPAAYVLAWRHVVNIFRQVGARNARFVWSPDGLIGEPQRSWTRSVVRWYPGRAYVSYVGMTTYAFASNIRWGLGGWMQRIDWLHRTYHEPMILPEMKVVAPSRYRWLRELRGALAKRPWISMVIWSESPTSQSETPGYGDLNWLLESDREARQLLLRAVTHSRAQRGRGGAHH